MANINKNIEKSINIFLSIEYELYSRKSAFHGLSTFCDQYKFHTTKHRKLPVHCRNAKEMVR